MFSLGVAGIVLGVMGLKQIVSRQETAKLTAFFAVKWLPQDPKRALVVLTIQLLLCLRLVPLSSFPIFSIHRRNNT